METTTNTTSTTTEATTAAVATLTAENQFITFDDASKKPALSAELEAQGNLRVVYKLERATASKDGTVKAKQHKAIAIIKQDWPAYFACALDVETCEPEDVANYTAARRALQNAFDDLQDAAVYSAIAEAQEQGRDTINPASYSADSICADLAAERTSNRLTKAAIVEWFAEHAAPALVSALVAKGAAEAKIAVAVEAASALLAKLAAIAPSLNDKQQEQVKKLLQLDTVSQHPMAQQLLNRVNNIKDDSALLEDLL